MDIYQFLTIETIIVGSTLGIIALVCIIGGIVGDIMEAKRERSRPSCSSPCSCGTYGHYTDYTDQDVAAISAMTTINIQ